MVELQKRLNGLNVCNQELFRQYKRVRHERLLKEKGMRSGVNVYSDILVLSDHLERSTNTAYQRSMGQSMNSWNYKQFWSMATFFISSLTAWQLELLLWETSSTCGKSKSKLRPRLLLMSLSALNWVPSFSRSVKCIQTFPTPNQPVFRQGWLYPLSSSKPNSSLMGMVEISSTHAKAPSIHLRKQGKKLMDSISDFPHCPHWQPSGHYLFDKHEREMTCRDVLCARLERDCAVNGH